MQFCLIANGDFGPFGFTDGVITPLDCSSFGGGFPADSCDTIDELQLGHMQTLFGPPTIVLRYYPQLGVCPAHLSALLLNSIWTEITDPIQRGEHRNMKFAGECLT